MQTDAGITSPVKRTETVTPEDPEAPIAASYWSSFLDSEVQIEIPKQVLFADIKAIIKLLNLPEDKTAGASIARVIQCVATNDGKKNAQKLLENTNTKLTQGQKEIINFCLAYTAAIENQVLERLKSKVPDLNIF